MLKRSVLLLHISYSTTIYADMQSADSTEIICLHTYYWLQYMVISYWLLLSAKILDGYNIYMWIINTME